MRIGLLGTGWIARMMARTVNGMKDVTLAAVASRNQESADSFAEEFGIEKAYGNYEALASDESVDLVFIGTPHSRHYDDCMMCISHGRNILCEKAFTANAKQAEEVINAAHEKGVFITEAIWTRYIPMKFTLDKIIESGVIGNITSLTANLGYAIGNRERLMKPELAGGALLDLGVYTINFALMVMGTDIEKITSECTKNEYGVDAHNSIIMKFSGGRTAVLHSTMQSNTDRRGIIFGDRGRIEFENINNCEGIKVICDDEVTVYETPEQITGYEYEVEASFAAIAAGKKECEQMPHEETIRVMKIMDSLRAEWGIKYPFE